MSCVKGPARVLELALRVLKGLFLTHGEFYVCDSLFLSHPLGIVTEGLIGFLCDSS